MSTKVPCRSCVCSLLLLGLMASSAAPVGPEEEAGRDLVERALASELQSAQDLQHPMRFRLRKSSPRFSTTKEIFETKDGAVARLIAIGDLPLSAGDEQKEETRLKDLLSNPGKQHHRKQAEVEDTERVLKVIRALPTAFLYEGAGSNISATGKIEKFTFRPNPDFDPPDLESEALTAMTGQLWIDCAQGRVVRLEGHLQRDVNFGWGVLGRLEKGGWIVIEQADVGSHLWRIVHFQMVMNGRVLFKNRNFDTEEVESNFAPVPLGTGYADAIRILEAESGQAGLDNR
jgi:hypothetical protein